MKKQKYFVKRWFVVGILFWSFIFYACATLQPQAPDKSEMAELDTLSPRRILEEPKQRPLPGPPPFTEQMAPLTKSITRSPVLYTLLFEKAPLGQVVSAITQDLDYNVSIESGIDLDRPVTVNLKNATLPETLDTIVVNGSGYAWALENNTLSIKRFEERIYHLDCLDLVGDTQVEVGGDMLGSGVENAGVAGKYKIKTEKSSQNSDLWKTVEEALGGLKSPDGILQLNRNAGVVYIADSPRKVAAMVRYLDSLSEVMNRQVFVEARIMEVTLSHDNSYGIDWSQLNIGFTEGGGILPSIFEMTFNRGGSVFKTDSSKLTGLLDFLKTQGDVKVLSNPHLTVMNRQSAMLTVGYQFPYADVEGVDRDAETGVITIGTSIRRPVLGLQLGLTAQISADGMVTFHIVPTLTRIQREVSIDIPLGWIPNPFPTPSSICRNWRPPCGFRTAVPLYWPG